MVIFIQLLAGLGFIFIGTQFLTANMKQAVGARFHTLIGRATGNPLKSAAAGVAAGAVIQSTNAVTFIVISLVTAGVATVRQAMPIVTWSYAGSSIRLLLASVDIGLVVLCGIALLGIAFLLGYDRDPKWRNLIAALLGLALLLYGVELMVLASAPLSNSVSVKNFLGLAQKFYPWGFIAGTVMASVVQGQTVSVIAVALAAGGVLSIDQTFLIVVGSNLGAGVMTVTQGAGLQGTARQLNLYQLILKLIGVSVFLPALAVEHYAGLPLVTSLITHITADAALQVTALHWMFQLVSAGIATPLNGPLYALLQRWSPPTSEETLGKPVFIGGLSDVQSSVARELIEKEQARLFHRLPHFLDQVRRPSEVKACGGEIGKLKRAPTRAELRQGGVELLDTIEKFVKATLDELSGKQDQDQLLMLWGRCQTLRDLQSTIDSLCSDLTILGKSESYHEGATNIAEAMHAVLCIAEVELSGPDPRDPKLVLDLTSDRAATLRTVRENLLARPPDASVDDRRALWATIDHVDNAIWLLQRYVRSFHD
jgi:phosphate:Na+ symporter